MKIVKYTEDLKVENLEGLFAEDVVEPEKFNELIMCVEREPLFENESKVFQGFKNINEFKKLKLEDILIARRGHLEVLPEYKQLITYAVLQDKSTKDLLLYKRLSGSGEQRLVDKTSIGVGGHTNLFKQETLDEVLYENFMRELEEELIIEADTEFSVVGYINDDSNDVGSVHLGVIYVVQTDKTKVSVNETDTLAIDWLPISEVQKDKNLESWSELIINNDEFLSKLQ